MTIHHKHIITYACLHPAATEKHMVEALTIAEQQHYQGIVVPSFWVKKIKRDMTLPGMQLITPIGYPYGYSRTEPKLTEIQIAMDEGVQAVEVALNTSAFLTNPKGWAKFELARFSKLLHRSETLLHVSMNPLFLSGDLFRDAVSICRDMGVDQVVLSPEAHPDHYHKVKEWVKDYMEVKLYCRHKHLLQTSSYEKVERIGLLHPVEYQLQ
ncbi:hypothetical protein [Algivirga pacifica]